MKVALNLDGLLSKDAEQLKEEWFRQHGDWKFLNDAAFWAALKPYDDVKEAVKLLDATDLYVFAERPKGLFLPTRAWLRNNCGIELNKDRLLVPALNRYDCRMQGINAFVSANPAHIENLKTETVLKIDGYLCDRGQGGSLIDTVWEILGEWKKSQDG